MAQVDLSDIKTQIKSILDTANTTTGSPIDLSNGLTNRVNKVLKINPDMFPVQASFFPCVTCYIDSKTSIEQDTIARTMTIAKRKSNIVIKINVGVYQNNCPDVTEDKSSQECEQLMENVEEILRANPTLTNTVKWSAPTEVQYYTSMINQETVVRAAEMDLKAVIFY